MLVPVYLRLERGHGLRWPLAALLGFLLVVAAGDPLAQRICSGSGSGCSFWPFPIATSSPSRASWCRSGWCSRSWPGVVIERRHFFETVISSRLQTGGNSTTVHFSVYDFIPQVLRSHPLLGLGLNNFSVYYQFVTGKTNWGPHSFYVSTLVEGGIIGSVIFAVFLWYLFRRLATTRELGRRLTRAGDPLGGPRASAWPGE